MNKKVHLLLKGALDSLSTCLSFNSQFYRLKQENMYMHGTYTLEVPDPHSKANVATQKSYNMLVSQCTQMYV